MRLADIFRWERDYANANSELRYRFDELVDNDKANEDRGFDGWVSADDGLPAVAGEYLVKGTAVVNGKTVEFVNGLELNFHIEDYSAWTEYFHDGLSRGRGHCFEDYDLVPHWEMGSYEYLAEKGIEDIEITAWKQWGDEEVECFF